MAFVMSPDQPAVNPAVNPQTTPISAGGAGVAGSSKAASVPGQNVPAQPSAQLSAYLNANQPQAANLAGNVANQAGQQVQAAGNAILPAVNTYTGNLVNVPTDTATNQAVAQSPSSLTPAQQETYKAELGASAKAPNSASTFETTQPYSDIVSQIQQATEQANLWNSGNNVANLSEAIRPYEGPNATTGDTTLDALLLSQNPEAYGQIQSAVAPAANLQGNLDAGATTANQALRDAIAADTATTAAANQSAQQYVTGLNSALADYLANAQNQVNAYNTSVNGLSAQEASVQPQIAALQNAIAAYNSMTASAQNPGYGTGPGMLGYNPIFNPTPVTLPQPSALPATMSQPSLAQVATPAQYSDISALQNYLGASGLQALAPSISPETSAQAGTYTTPSQTPTLSSIMSPTITGAQDLVAASDIITNAIQGKDINGGANLSNEYLAGIAPYVGQGTMAALAALALTQPEIMPIVAVLAGYGATLPGGEVINDQITQPGNPALARDMNQYIEPIYNAINSLESAMIPIMQSSGSQNTPAAPSNAVAPANGQPGNEAWFNYIHSQYPNFSGFPATYQDYLNHFAQGTRITVQ